MEITMWVLALEAIAAFFIGVFVVWWTMFSGKLPEDMEQESDEHDTPQNQS
jgi:hypothetical protein